MDFAILCGKFSQALASVTNSHIWFGIKNVDLTPAKNSKPCLVFKIDVYYTGFEIFYGKCTFLGAVRTFFFSQILLGLQRSFAEGWYSRFHYNIYTNYQNI